jgi:GldM C-terminal domain
MKRIFLSFSLIHILLCASNAQNAVVSAEKMSVLYMGVDNPISIAVPNVPSNKLIVTGDNIQGISKVSDGNYIVRVAQKGEATIIVEANGQITKKKFIVKPLPDPVIRISGVRSGHFYGNFDNVQNFKWANALIAYLGNSDFDARCTVQSFTIIINPKRGDAYKVNVIGSAFSEEIKKRFLILEIGDTVNFFDIKVRCPGDNAARDLRSLSHTMK